jgi:hypothetical protein
MVRLYPRRLVVCHSLLQSPGEKSLQHGPQIWPSTLLLVQMVGCPWGLLMVALPTAPRTQVQLVANSPPHDVVSHFLASLCTNGRPRGGHHPSQLADFDVNMHSLYPMSFQELKHGCSSVTTSCFNSTCIQYLEEIISRFLAIDINK